MISTYATANRSGRSLLLFVTIVILVSAPAANAWLPCERSFHFLGKTTGDTCTISFWEVAFGSCERWQTHHLVIGPDGELLGHTKQGADPPTTPLQNTELVKGRTIDWIQRLVPDDSGFTDAFSIRNLFHVRAPARDSAFWPAWHDTLDYVRHSRKAFDRHFGNPDWLSEHFDPPVFNKPVELVYRYHGGLYKNYDIIDVLFTGGYFIILTHQPVTANEYTFDGLLVYRLIRK